MIVICRHASAVTVYSPRRDLHTATRVVIPGLVYLHRDVCSGSQCNVYLLARLLHLEHPAGTVVVVGVAVVLQVDCVLHFTVLYCTVPAGWGCTA